ncbi:hypothetical protein C5167_044426 [Papaver somniferum]|uniref:Uncharacterized protein n=1 Tax=Papaver somniferum TaxID=3469 RepID=A0A4Y7LCG1_PAPSO|nr:hypothetical protein C5167_044426 [Papaver somniferum]
MAGSNVHPGVFL